MPHPLAGLFQADTPRSRRRAYGPLATAALAAAAVLAGVVYALVTIGHPGTLAGPGRGGSHAATGHTGRSQPTAGPGGGGPAVIPAGWHEFRNSTGFSIAVPDGWRVSHQGHYVYLLPPSGAMFLLIDQSDHPQPNPLADWQQQEANRRGSYPGYHRIRVTAGGSLRASGKGRGLGIHLLPAGCPDARAEPERAGERQTCVRPVLVHPGQSVEAGLAPLRGIRAHLPARPGLSVNHLVDDQVP